MTSLQDSGDRADRARRKLPSFHNTCFGGYMPIRRTGDLSAERTGVSTGSLRTAVPGVSLAFKSEPAGAPVSRYRLGTQYLHRAQSGCSLHQLRPSCFPVFLRWPDDVQAGTLSVATAGLFVRIERVSHLRAVKISGLPKRSAQVHPPCPRTPGRSAPGHDLHASRVKPSAKGETLLDQRLPKCVLHAPSLSVSTSGFNRSMLPSSPRSASAMLCSARFATRSHASRVLLATCGV